MLARRVRDPVGGELPALLLELPGGRGARLRPRDHLHERGGDRLRQPHRRGLAGAAPAPSRRASSSRTTSRAASTRRSTGWAGTTTRTASRIPGYGHPVVLSGDDTFTRAGVAAVPLPARRRERSCGPTRARSTRSGRATRRSTTTATCRATRPCRARSSRCRRRSRRAIRRRSRTGRTRTTSSSSSGSRTSPTTGPIAERRVLRRHRRATRAPESRRRDG